MRYAIVAIGSRGDVQPYVALALGLKMRGHETVICAHENFKDFVEGYGIGFIPVAGHVEAMLQSAEGMKMLRNGSLAAFTKYLQRVNKITTQSLIESAPQFKKADILIASLLAIPWVDAIAERFGKKWAIVQLNLPAVPTRAFPMILLDYFHFPAYNLFTYRLYEWVYWMANKKNVNAFRLAMGLPKMKRPILKEIRDAGIPNLHCFSPALLTRPGDWPSETDITGFLFLPPATEQKIPDALSTWLAAKEKPVYIGVGSRPVPDPGFMITIIQELLAKTTDRFIYCYGWTPPMNLPVNPRLFEIKSAPHEWLFPHCRTAIIHGGVGTTAAALRAKIPVIIVSIIADQPWWGKIIERKGVGMHIPFKKLTAQKLIFALEKTASSEFRQRASQLGEQINAESGLSVALDKIEKISL
jgi:sterol 3beta-glucosyltransferase